MRSIVFFSMTPTRRREPRWSGVRHFCCNSLRASLRPSAQLGHGFILKDMPLGPTHRATDGHLGSAARHCELAARLQPIFDAILDSATRLCRADSGALPEALASSGINLLAWWTAGRLIEVGKRRALVTDAPRLRQLTPLRPHSNRNQTRLSAS
jgi:hypothetical protein